MPQVVAHWTHHSTILNRARAELVECSVATASSACQNMISGRQGPSDTQVEQAVLEVHEAACWKVSERYMGITALRPANDCFRIDVGISAFAENGQNARAHVTPCRKAVARPPRSERQPGDLRSSRAEANVALRP